MPTASFFIKYTLSSCQNVIYLTNEGFSVWVYVRHGLSFLWFTVCFRLGKWITGTCWSGLSVIKLFENAVFIFWLKVIFHYNFITVRLAAKEVNLWLVSRPWGLTNFTPGFKIYYCDHNHLHPIQPTHKFAPRQETFGAHLLTKVYFKVRLNVGKGIREHLDVWCSLITIIHPTKYLSPQRLCQRKGVSFSLSWGDTVAGTVASQLESSWFGPPGWSWVTYLSYIS